jgi:hypothetical protein
VKAQDDGVVSLLYVKVSKLKRWGKYANSKNEDGNWVGRKEGRKDENDGVGK